jgi:hypothetical protein
VICKEVFADNAMSLYKSNIPCFYNPKLITDTSYKVSNLDINSTTHNPLPTGFGHYDYMHNYNHTYAFIFLQLLKPGDVVSYGSTTIHIVDENFVKDPEDPKFYQPILISDDYTENREILARDDILITIVNITIGVYLIKSNEEITEVSITINDAINTETEKRLYAIDFGYNELSEEFQQLPEGFRFRLTDPVFGYNYEAIKKDNLWNYTYGNLHYQLAGGKGITSCGYFRGPALVMNESNRLALKIAMEAINKPDVDGFEKMWKTLWEHSTVTISKNTKGRATARPFCVWQAF